MARMKFQNKSNKKETGGVLNLKQHRYLQKANLYKNSLIVILSIFIIENTYLIIRLFS